MSLFDWADWEVDTVRNYYGDPMYVGRCGHCHYVTRKFGYPGYAERVVKEHVNDKHGGAA